MKNQVQLITYTDRISGGNLQSLYELITGPLKGLFGGIHLLPFYEPFDGADAGFDPIDHSKVDPRLGNWDDIKRLSAEVNIMADLIVNHISNSSPQFIDYSKKGDTSSFKDLFLSFDSVFPKGATEHDLLNIYRPRPGLPFSYMTLISGDKKLLWTTFTSKQVDINVKSPVGRNYLEGIMNTFAQAGISMIRLDAAGYAIKKAGTSCFMIPETFNFIEDLSGYAQSLDIEVLVEIHSYYKTQIDIARSVNWVYDFALPPLILHAFFTKKSSYLKHWFTICPRNCITVLDTHDGIGIIDIGPGIYQGIQQPGLVPDEELDTLVEQIHINSNGESRKATGAAASNLDLYQVNCTYYDALGADDKSYLLARAIQFFAPGIPQVYYMGLLCHQNDMVLLKRSNVGRDINRHYFNKDQIQKQLQKNVVKQLLRLIRFRNLHSSFQGNFQLPNSDDRTLIIRWTFEKEWSQIIVDFKDLSYEIKYSVDNQSDKFELDL